LSTPAGWRSLKRCQFLAALSDAQAKLEEQTEKASSLGQQVEALTDEVGSVKVALAEAQARRDAAESRQALLEKAMGERDGEQSKVADSLKQDLVQAQQRAAASHQRVTELEAEVKSLNGQIATLTSSEEATRTQVSTLQQEADQGKAAIAQLQKDKAALQADLEKARTAAASAAAVDNSGTPP
jgi:DNA repair exonuclease SbcCD ATPase subunit